MKIAVLGATGFIGSSIFEHLSKFHSVSQIVRGNYSTFRGTEFDVFINANGNSKKYLADHCPEFDFEASVHSTFNTIFDFKFKKYIFLSSLDAFTNTIYGINKKTAEDILSKFSRTLNFDLSIIRLGAVIGKGMSKGVVHDILGLNNIRISSESSLQLITVQEVTKFIQFLVESKTEYMSPILLAGTHPIKVFEIANLLGRKVEYEKGVLPYQFYHYDIEPTTRFYPLKTSEEYVKELIKCL